MSYRIETDETVQRAVQRVAREQLGKALDSLEDPSDVHEAVHDARKKLKKVRALVRLVRPSFDGYADTNRACRDAGRRLAELRDAQSDLTTFEEVCDRRADVIRGEVMRPIGLRLLRRRDRLTREVAATRLERVRSELRRVDGDVGSWSLDDAGLEAVAGGLEKTYRRARKRMEDAYEARTVEAFHELRKRVKYHRYHVRLLGELWTGPLDVLREELHDITDWLGDAHDRAELAETIRELPPDPREASARRALRAFLRQEHDELCERARPVAERAFAQEPEAFVERLAALWRAAA